MTRLLLADDHVVVRQAFRVLLERFGFEVVAEADDGDQAIQLARALRPDAAIMDVWMPRLDGLRAARTILEEGTCRHIVLLSGWLDETGLAQARAAGVRGYVPKALATDELIEAINTVCGGGAYFSSPTDPVVPPGSVEPVTPPVSVLTPREREVLRLIAQGRSSREIAYLLHVSFKTIDTHRTNIMHKLDVHKAAGLVRYAVRSGLVQP